MKIICIGRNYVDHAKELNNDIPTEPLFFLKPDSAQLSKKVPFVIPPWTEDVHFEVEILLRVNRLGKYIQPKFAHKYYNAIGLGIDFTARDVQQRCKDKGHPWEKAKGFDGSAVISPFIEKETFADLSNIDFRLEVNGEVRQQGNTSDLIFKFDELIAHISQYMTLKDKDVIFTGTPAGVGPVQPGDKLEGFIGDQSMFKVRVK